MKPTILITKIVFISLFLTGCAAFQPFADDMEKMADDNAITVKVNKEAMQKDTNVQVNVSVLNKTP